MSYTIDSIYGCWRYSRVDRDGYAIRWQDNRCISIHREEYVNAYGPIPKDHDIEHSCRRRNCARPSHLVAVTKSQNQRLRSWRHRVKVKECPQGHLHRRWGLRTPEGGAVCRVCNEGAI